jgi:nitrogen regulatory protein P-II 1
MKKLEAIVRKSKFSEVKQALLKEGIEFFSYWKVRDMGKDYETRVYRGVEYKTPAAERIWLSIFLEDKDVDTIVQLIIQSGRTGDVGDGRIFITPIEDAYRIRTGVNGDEALNFND